MSEPDAIEPLNLRELVWGGGSVFGRVSRIREAAVMATANAQYRLEHPERCHRKQAKPTEAQRRFAGWPRR
jgi:hypothetical protein